MRRSPDILEAPSPARFMAVVICVWSLAVVGWLEFIDQAVRP